MLHDQTKYSFLSSYIYTCYTFSCWRALFKQKTHTYLFRQNKLFSINPNLSNDDFIIIICCRVKCSTKWKIHHISKLHLIFLLLCVLFLIWDFYLNNPQMGYSLFRSFVLWSVVWLQLYWSFYVVKLAMSKKAQSQQCLMNSRKLKTENKQNYK